MKLPKHKKESQRHLFFFLIITMRTYAGNFKFPSSDFPYFLLCSAYPRSVLYSANGVCPCRYPVCFSDSPLP